MPEGDIFIAFIDLTKAFDTVNRDLLWQVLSKFGCPPHFLSILREFHTDVSASVVQGGDCRRVLVLTQELNRAVS